MGIDIRELSEKALQALQPSVPFLVHSAASAGTFAVCLGAAQAAGVCCRVSCATPVLGSAFGLIGVGLAGCAAGQVSAQCQRYYSGRPPGRPPAWPQGQPLGPFVMPTNQDLLVDAAIGVLLFKALGGRFRNVMPSDLHFPGAYAKASVPATGKNYAGSGTKAELVRHMRRDGCHHCGIKHGECVGDHMPPNKQVHGPGYKLIQQARRQLDALGMSPPVAGRKKATRKARTSRWFLTPRLAQWLQNLKMGIQGVVDPASTMPLQRYYPQCRKCSNKQSVAVRNDKRTLVTHRLSMKTALLTGTIVGLRSYGAPPSSPPEGYSRRRGNRGPTQPGSGSDAFGLGRWMCIPTLLANDLSDRMDKQARHLVAEAHRFHPRIILH